jgi:hypothetical protein
MFSVKFTLGISLLRIGTRGTHFLEIAVGEVSIHSMILPSSKFSAVFALRMINGTVA